jgi:hypothetical protein
LPYKRFAAPDLLALASDYLHESSATYRSVVRHDRCLIGYPPLQEPAPAKGDPSTDPSTDSPKKQQDAPMPHQPVVPPSLVWRFVGWLGALSFSLDKARQMLLQRNPNSLCHRTAAAVAPRKAVTEARGHTLETARQLLLIMPEWDGCFDDNFFPRFATKAGFD